MNAEEAMLQRVCALATENGRMRFLIGEAITSMSHAEVFIGSREKMHPEGRRQWSELLDRLHEVIADSPTVSDIVCLTPEIGCSTPKGCSLFGCKKIDPEPPQECGNESALLVGGE